VSVTFTSRADVHLTIKRTDLDEVILGRTGLETLLKEGKANAEGDVDALHQLIELLDQFEFWFNIVTP
jgi:alkyl sulfatase BDS1-like metallo-beta-lactamase superfamily hydrolase